MTTYERPIEAMSSPVTMYLDPEPECCGEPMVHNSNTGEYECADGYFSLVDDGVFGGGMTHGVDVVELTDCQRERYEHWLSVRVPDAERSAKEG